MPRIRLSLSALMFCLAGALVQAPALQPARAQDNAAETHMVAAANPHAVEAGLEMLRRGGSAVDAAVATQAVLGLVEPQSSGIGGGGFLMHYDPDGDRLQAFDGRETEIGRASCRERVFPVV